MSALAVTRNLLTRNINAICEHHAREAQIARQVAYLNSFDDHLLADIGLNRSDIEAYVSTRMGQRARPADVQDASPMLHNPFIAVALGGVANVGIVMLLAYYPARWLGLW